MTDAPTARVVRRRTAIAVELPKVCSERRLAAHWTRVTGERRAYRLDFLQLQAQCSRCDEHRRLDGRVVRALAQGVM